MAVPESTVWDRDPHTEAKHRVLGRYFDAWYPIMLRTFPRLTVLEGYAGPGIYSKGEDGSPVIALSTLAQRPELLDGGKAVRFVFVEEREDRLQKLKEVVGKRVSSTPKRNHCGLPPRALRAHLGNGSRSGECLGYADLCES